MTKFTWQKKSNDKEDKLLIKNLLDQIEILKQEPKIIKIILENYRQTIDYKSPTAKETAKQNHLSDKGEREFLMPRKTVKNKIIKQYFTIGFSKLL